MQQKKPSREGEAENARVSSFEDKLSDPGRIAQGLGECGYVADTELATTLYLMAKLGRPLLIEGEAGVGKTEVACTLAPFLETRLIRLQCYEGLDLNSAVYEWDYRRQLLAIRIQESSQRSEEEKESYIYSRRFLLERPLLSSITQDRSPVLLIDEIDRSDEEFEAFLLELLSSFQVTVPELGTIQARRIPLVILTSNRTRELSDALRRRCLYLWLDYPDAEKELRIIRKRLPGIGLRLARQVIEAVRRLRQMDLDKSPGVAETLDWASALAALGAEEVDRPSVEATLGAILKTADDIGTVRACEDDWP